MDGSWKSALRTAGGAGVCAMLATVLWDGINPREPALVAQAGRVSHLKRVDVPDEPMPVTQETVEGTLTTHPTLMTFAPTATLDLPVEPPMPPAAPAAPGPFIEEPDIPGNFV